MKLKKIMALLCTVTMIFALVGCGKATIEGTWSGALGSDSEISFTFEEDGTGVYNKGGITLSSTYRTEGDQLIITMSFLGQSQDETYTYKIDGKTLTLTDANGQEMTLTKE